MKTKELHRLLDKTLKTKSAEQIRVMLQTLLEPNDSPLLTIVANAGIHDIPKMYLRGEVYEASRGNWDVSTQKALVQELGDILSRLADKLRSQRWMRIYLIPTGHPILSLQIKAMVYRVLRINTIDLYHKDGQYFEIDINQREIALKRNLVKK